MKITNLFHFILIVFVCSAWSVMAEITNPAETVFWSDARMPYPGIFEKSFYLMAPRRMAVWMVRIDLNNPSIRFVTNNRAENWGEPMPDYPELTIRTRGQSVSSFMLEGRAPREKGGRALPMVMAVNASPWGPWTNPYNHKFADGMGCMISDGVLVSPPNGRWCFCVPQNGGKPFFRKIDPNEDISNIQLSLPGFEMILLNGQIIVSDAPNDLAPRTAYGLSEDKHWMYILVTDGRQKDYSMGACLYELAQLMKMAGAHEAINMDGGGSTTLVFWDAVNRVPRMLNKPTASGNYQRPVGNALGVCIVPVPSPQTETLPESTK